MTAAPVVWRGQVGEVGVLALHADGTVSFADGRVDNAYLGEVAQAMAVEVREAMRKSLDLAIRWWPDDTVECDCCGRDVDGDDPTKIEHDPEFWCGGYAQRLREVEGES